MMNSNNKGFGKFEILTIVVFVFAILAYLLYLTLNGADSQKFTTMRENAVRLANTVTTNSYSFHNTEVVYLQEVIDEKILDKIKSPFSSNNCDASESKVEVIDGQPHVTLKCDDYLIDKVPTNSYDKMKIYKVGKWELERKDESDDEKSLYNCISGGREIYSNYTEELYMVSRINEENNTEYYFSTDASEVCEPVTKTFYRSKKLVNEK